MLLWKLQRININELHRRKQKMTMEIGSAEKLMTSQQKKVLKNSKILRLMAEMVSKNSSGSLIQFTDFFA